MLQMGMTFEGHLNSLGRERGGEWSQDLGGREKPRHSNCLTLGNDLPLMSPLSHGEREEC